MLDRQIRRYTVSQQPNARADRGGQVGGGLVEDEDLRLVDERAGDRQAAPQATGQRLHLVPGPVGELHEFQQRRRPLPDDAAG
jgi:hypothetical protein